MQYFLNYKYFEFFKTQKMKEFLGENWMKNWIFKLKEGQVSSKLLI